MKNYPKKIFHIQTKLQSFVFFYLIKKIIKIAPSLLIVSLLVTTNYVFAATATIRQEINIIDAIITASGDDSAIIQLDTTQYSGATYYFETVASVSSGTLTVALERVGTATQDATISVTATSFTRQRSSSFTPPAGQTEYNINLSGGTGPQVKSARIIIVQSANPISATQTQIEIGNKETGKNNTSSSALSNPKYWYYDSSKWDGSPTVYAEVTYLDIQVASTTTYKASATTTTTSYTYRASTGVSYVKVEAWGSGGGGGCTTSGGGGGGGGGYARSTIAISQGTAISLSVGKGGAGETDGTNTTYNSTTVVGAGGLRSLNSASGAGGTSNTGEFTANGAAGGTPDTTPDTGGAGGGAGGPDGAGAVGQNGQPAAGGQGGQGDNGSGGTGGIGGVSGNTAGKNGVSNLTKGGGGGGGSFTSGTVGGNGGAPGGGGGGLDSGTCSGATGGAGQIILTETHGKVGVAIEEDNGSFGSWTFKAQIVSAGTSTSTPSRVRSASFTPTSGRNYRLVASTTASTASYEIYNAKIIIDQTDPTLLEPQYLLANTGSFGGSTGLKDFDTLFDPAEWSGVTNVYIHEGNGVSAGTGDLKLQQDPNGTPADISGSTITNTIEREQSSSMTMPVSSQILDVNVTGTGTLNASRILVQVSVDANPPVVSTDFVSQVSSTAVTLNGTKISGDNAVQHGFAYSTNSGLSTGVSTTTLGTLNSNTTFNSSISGLTQNQTYYYRAYASSSPTAIGFGVIRSFYTGNSNVVRKMLLFQGSRAKLYGKLKLNQQ